MNNKKPLIKAILFDVGGVLRINSFLNWNKKHSGVHEYIAKKIGIDIDSWFDSIDSVYADSLIGKASRSKFISVVSKNNKISKEKLVFLVKKAYKKRLKKNKKLYRIAMKLKKNGYLIGILSDQWALSSENLIPDNDRKEFDLVIISSEVGFRKPDIKIYKLVIKKIKERDRKIKANEILFIDNREWNLRPARKLRIKTILFESNRKLIRDFKDLGLL